MTDGNDAEPAKRHASRFDLCLFRYGIDAMTILYSTSSLNHFWWLDSQYPDLQETQSLEDLERQLKEWY